MGGRNRFTIRLAVVGAGCAVAAAAVVARMVYLVVVQGPVLRGEVARITSGETIKIAYRGPILDRNGTALATSVASSRIGLRRKAYRFQPEHVDLLAPLLGVDRETLRRKLAEGHRPYEWLARYVGVEQAAAIRRLNIPGIDVHRHQQRSYPQGTLAAHVLGFVGVDAQGLEGIERLYDDRIRGEPVSVRVRKDSKGRVFYNESDLAGINRGASIVLTLDATLQSIAEAELARQVEKTKAAAGSVVMMNPRTGEILAMANVPTFDPNFYQQWPAAARRNRAVTDLFEPGSTVKPFVVAAALDAGVVRPDDRFYCEHGSIRIGGWTIHDHHPHDELTVAEIVKVSSNIGAAKIGAAVGAERLYRYLRAFGFGRASGVGLPGDRAGVLPPPEKWRPITLANISFGQGLSVTATELASAYAALANDGVRMRPFIVRQIVAADGSVLLANGPYREGRAVRAETARAVTRMLEAVVADGGTAPQARIDGVAVAGKTGTAQKVENGRYSHRRWVASFVGYLPAGDPRLLIAVVIDEPQTNHYGGVVAAPVFRRIAEASLDYLHIPRAVPREVPVVEAAAPQAVPVPRVPAFDGKMPDVRGLSLRSALHAFDGCQCGVRVDGAGYVRSQEPPPGTRLASNALVRLELSPGGDLAE